MLKLISRNEQYLNGYREYCQEFYENNIYTFRPMNPESVSLKWFRDSFDWYRRREQGLVKGQPKSIHFWAVDDTKFIGEFQLRTELTDDLMNTIGSVGYSVRITEQGKGYGKCILSEGLQIARKLGLDKVILLINETNTVSRHICEELGGDYFDTVLLSSDVEGEREVCRYWIYLNEYQAVKNTIT